MKNKKDWFIFVVIAEIVVVVLLIIFLGAFTDGRIEYETNDILWSIDADNYKITSYVERTTPELLEPKCDVYPHANNNIELTVAQKEQVFEENQNLMNEVVNDIENENLKKHPISDIQFAGKVSDEAKAATIDVTINTKFLGVRSLGIYAPAGEVLTINFPNEVVNKGLIVRIGYPSDNSNLSNTNDFRLPLLTKSFVVNSEILNIGTPYGGLVYLFVPSSFTNESFRLTISGGIPSAVYSFGNTNIEQWNDLKLYESPYVELRTGLIRFIVPTNKIRNMSNPENVLKFWYYASSYLNNLIGNEKRVTPVIIVFTDDIKGNNKNTHLNSSLSMLSQDLIDDVFDYDNILRNGSYQVIKEVCNLLSSNYTWGVESLKETNVDALVSAVYMMYTNVASYRVENEVLDNEKYLSDAYNTLKNLINDIGNKPLNTYVTFMHSFGTSSIIDLINSYNNKELINELPEGIALDSWDALCYLSSRIYQKNMTNFFEEIVKVKVDENIKNLIILKNYEHYIPVANLYTLGYGVVKTGRPFYIPYDESYIFDFKKYMISPTNDYTLNIDGFKNGRVSSLGNGVYSYKMYDNKNEDDFTLSLTFKEGTINLYGKIVQDQSMFVVKRYTDIENDNLEFVLLHNMLKDIDAIKVRNYGINFEQMPINYNGCYNYIEGKIIPTQTGRHFFFLKGADAIDFYFGNAIDNPTKKAVIRAEQKSYNVNNTESYFEVDIEAGEEYFFKIYNYSKDSSGNVTVGWITPDRINYQKNSKGETYIGLSSSQVIDIPNDVIYHKLLTENNSPREEMYKNVDYQYRYLNIGNIEYLNKENMDVISAPYTNDEYQGNSIIDDDLSTIYRAEMEKDDQQMVIPHEYVIDLGKEQSFNYLELFVSEPAVYKINEFDLAVGNSLDNMKQVISGANNNDVLIINFSNVSARYIRIKILKTINNYTNVAEINIGTIFNISYTIPNTSSKLTYSGEWNSNLNNAFGNGSIFEGEGKVTFEFSGSTLAFYACTSSEYGKARIKIDGNDFGTISFDSSVDAFQKLVYLINNLENKSHKVEIESDGLFNIDYFVIG